MKYVNSIALGILLMLNSCELIDSAEKDDSDLYYYFQFVSTETGKDIFHNKPVGYNLDSLRIGFPSEIGGGYMQKIEENEYFTLSEIDSVEITLLATRFGADEFYFSFRDSLSIDTLSIEYDAETAIYQKYPDYQIITQDIEDINSVSFFWNSNKIEELNFKGNASLKRQFQLSNDAPKPGSGDNPYVIKIKLNPGN